MDMAEKLELLDRDYLSKMPKGTSRPQLTVQHEQAGACVELPYYTENPEPDEVQCALAWYTGAFADRERQLGVEILLDALLGTNNSPLKAALLAEKLGADIDIGFDDSTLQPVLELVLRGATEESARKFAAAVRKAVDGILAEGIPQELLLASLNAAEFASLERPGTLPDGVLDAINASTGWLHTGDPALLLHTDRLFASLRERWPMAGSMSCCVSCLHRLRCRWCRCPPCLKRGERTHPHRRQACAGAPADRCRPWRRSKDGPR